MTKKVMLFLGSGVSYATGLPTVQRITDCLLNGWWWKHTDERFYCDGSPSVGSVPVAPRAQSFLKELRSHADAYAAQKYESTATYEDLYFLCQQIEDEETGEIFNPAMRPFVELLRHKIEPFCQPYQPPNEDRVETLQSLASESCRLIECVVERLLATKNTPIGLGLIQELAQAPETEMTIATLNHDLLVETVLGSVVINYADGFRKRDGGVAWFDPRELIRPTKVTLLKLHGSIDWCAYRDAEGNRPWRWAKSRELSVEDAQGRYFRTPTCTCLIGSYNKLASYHFGHFADIHLSFFQRLREHSMMVMSGYGWNDRWMNGRLIEWLDLRRENRIVLLHEHPERLKFSKSAMWHRYDDLRNKGKFIPIEKWLSETRLDEILPHLQAACT